MSKVKEVTEVKETRSYVGTEVKNMVIAQGVQKHKGKDHLLKMLGEVGFMNKEKTEVKRLPGMEDITVADFDYEKVDLQPLVDAFEAGEVPTNKVARTYKKMRKFGHISQKMVDEAQATFAAMQEAEAEAEAEAEVEEVKEEVEA